MSFTDLLRNARSSRGTVVHKFLTNYDPNSDRLFAFVEGDADEVFYRAQIQKYVPDQRQIYLYNCEGKQGVCNAYEDIVGRYPKCERVLFFLDKDLDDLVSARWPADPRIFTTECYSIENYVVSMESLSRYFKDFVKIRRVEIDLDTVLVHFDDGLNTFHRLMLPVMAWIVVVRRSGARVNLQDVNPGLLFQVSDEGTYRKQKRGIVAYLCRVGQVGPGIASWKLLRRAFIELRRLPAKSYVRGKFEAWWFIEFGQRVLEGVIRVAQESHGSVKVTAHLNIGAFIQLLAAGTQTPAPLDKFLGFHTRRQAEVASGPPAEVSSWHQFMTSILKKR